MNADDRLDELPELDAQELALLAAFAQDEQPSAAARDRVKARVLETTVAAAPTGTVLRGPWVPWIAGSVLAAAAAALLVVTMSGDSVTAQRNRGLQQAPNTPETAQGLQARQEAEPSPTRRQRPADTTPAVSPPQPGPEPEPAAPSPALSEAPAPAAEMPAGPRTPRRGSSPRKLPKPEPQPAPSPSSLAEETRLLEQAREAVTKNRPSKALGILRDAQERFPNGVLRQERAVLRVVALCDAGKVAAGRSAAASFLRAHPRSALRSRVESACPEATP